MTPTRSAPADRERLAKVEAHGQTTLAGTWHTQTETVQQIILEDGGDNVLAGPPPAPHTVRNLMKMKLAMRRHV